MFEQKRETAFRFLAFLPVCFFLAHLQYHFSLGTPAHLLWMCNISNLLLAAGLFFRIATLIRVAVLWQIPGLPLWVIDMTHTGDDPYSTFLSHVGGLIIGLIAMSKVRAKKNTWILALAYGLAMQQICRWFTPPDLNVNVAWGMYYGWDRIFDSYWKFWLMTAAQAAAGLWLLELILLRIFPARPAATVEAKRQGHNALVVQNGARDHESLNL